MHCGKTTLCMIRKNMSFHLMTVKRVITFVQYLSLPLDSQWDLSQALSSLDFYLNSFDEMLLVRYVAQKCPNCVFCFSKSLSANFDLFLEPSSCTVAKADFYSGGRINGVFYSQLLLHLEISNFAQNCRIAS